MMSEYSKYRGKTCGRCFHYIHEILQHGYSGSIHTDEIQCGDIALTYHGKLLATIERWDDDLPFMKFHNIFEPWSQFVYSATRSQFIKRPFIDDPELLMNVDYAVQEVRKALSFEDALFITWVRDTLDGDWNAPSGDQQYQIMTKVIVVLRKSYHNRLSDEKMLEHWKHFALCAVYGVTNASDAARRKENRRDEKA